MFTFMIGLFAISVFVLFLASILAVLCPVKEETNSSSSFRPFKAVRNFFHALFEKIRKKKEDRKWQKRFYDSGKQNINYYIFMMNAVNR